MSTTPTPLDLDSVSELIKTFLTRSNPNTTRSYREALEDFRTDFHATSIEAIILRLLNHGQNEAEKLVTKYRLRMIGRVGKSGKIESGRGLGPATINLRLVVLRSLVRAAKKNNLIDWELAVHGVKDERVHDVRGPNEQLLNKMLDAAKSKAGPQGLRDYAILRIAGELGLRRKEITGLDLDDFDGDVQEIRVLGKGDTQKRALVCTARTAEAIQAWINVRPKPRGGSPLFTNLIPGRARRITGSAVYEIVRSLGRAALPKTSPRKISPHKIRHTAITSAVRLAREAGLAREDVKRFSRHKDMRMVNRYLDADDNAQAILAKKVGDRLV